MTLDEEQKITKRKIGVTIESSLNLLPAHEIQADIEKLKLMQSDSRLAIRANRKEIEKQKFEQINLLKLVEDPTSLNDGIIYNSEACQKSADRCNDHIRMFEALIKKEREKIKHIDEIIKEIEERRCLSEKISQLNGNEVLV